jgi:hypothetical protein
MSQRGRCASAALEKVKIEVLDGVIKLAFFIDESAVEAVPAADLETVVEIILP